MVLYNVTFHINDTRSLLRAIIPKSAADDENKAIPRVCFADSIEHCISAIGPSFRDLRKGGTIWVRVADIPDNELMTPQELFDKGYVMDALENQEYWCLHDVVVEPQLYCIDDFNAHPKLAFSCIKLDDVRRIIRSYKLVPNNVDAYTDAYSLYEYCLQCYNDWKAYDLMDALWDDLAELPWAQGFAVIDLKLRKASIIDFR